MLADRHAPQYSFDMILALLLTACTPDVCIPGETQECLCSDGDDGVQACDDAGDRYSDCECDDGTPSTDTAGSTDGAELFFEDCAACHGVEGEGGRNGPDLTEKIPNMTDAEVREIITEGEDEMPSFNYAEDQLDALVAWLREAFG